MTKQISLTKNMVAIVDDEDFALVSKYKWSAQKSRNTYYAGTSVKLPGEKEKNVLMHRLILGSPDGLIDHKDGDGLNNTRLNIRACTYQQNMFNRYKRSTSKSSQYKGVSWEKGKKKWRSHIQINGKGKSLGCYSDPAEAASAYDRAAKEMFGEFARLNFPEKPAPKTRKQTA